MNYTALILAGGEGTRLKPLTLKIPKPSIPLVNKPFLFYQMDLIDKAGIKNCILLSGYKSDILKRTFKKKYKNLRIEIVEEKEPLGTGGAIGFIKDEISTPVVVFNGDVLLELDLEKIIKEHKIKNAEGTILTKEVENPSRYGVILAESNGKIINFLEKVKEPPSNLINAGLYIFEKNVLKEIPKKNSSIEREVFPNLIKNGFNLYIHKYNGYWKDIGTVESYKEATIDILSGKLSLWKKEALKNRVLSKIKDVEIDEFSVLGKGCKIGQGTKIKKSIIFDGCKIGKNCIIENSIISNNVILNENSTVKEEVLIED